MADLLSGQYTDAYILLHNLYKQIDNSDITRTSQQFSNVIRNRLFITCMSFARSKIEEFQSDKETVRLDEAIVKLEEANTLYPCSYNYNLLSAYCIIVLNRDASRASKCISICKQLNFSQEWKYSEAFLTAYRGLSASTIISKYEKAFKSEYNLLLIVDYIEYIIDCQGYRNGLHLAAALVYSEINDIELMTEHIESYLAAETGKRNISVAQNYLNEKKAQRSVA